MADTPTKVSDVFVPEQSNAYVRENTTRVNAFFQGGIMATVPDLVFPQKGGQGVAMPFWKALGERAQLIDDNDDLEIRKIQSGQDFAVMHARALVYGATDLSDALAGDDPMDAINAGLTENWSYEFNMMTFATLKGAMGALAAEGTPVNSINISTASGAAAYLDGEAFIDGAQTMGDAKGGIVGVGMHSAVNAWLAKQGLIETIRDADGVVQYETFMGKRIVQDDANAPTTGVYTTYLFGAGALGFGEGSPKVPSATDRDELKNGGEEFVVSRRHFVIHPRGIKWNPISGVPASATPSDAELANPANWVRCWEAKNIRLVQIKHKIG
ncbi:major capsid protein [Hyphomicrobium sp. DY-1]|uniref:major capsid protein n=1 Tax=Hyphomicrobium sp. DY-1 TaxID=3075650 RepID=UPI0039C38A65